MIILTNREYPLILFIKILLFSFLEQESDESRKAH